MLTQSVAEDSAGACHRPDALRTQPAQRQNRESPNLIVVGTAAYAFVPRHEIVSTIRDPLVLNRILTNFLCLPVTFWGILISVFSSFLNFVLLVTDLRESGAFRFTESEDSSMDQEQLMDIKEVASYLRVKDSTVYTWAKEGILPAFRLGRLWRFRRADLDAWLENKRHQPAEEETSADEA